MRNQPAASIERWRVRTGRLTSPDRAPWGFFRVGNLTIIATDGRDALPEYGPLQWEHVSVSTPSRCPTWDEMEAVRLWFWRPVEVVIQIHPDLHEKVNYHPFCLHLWKPVGFKIPTPPQVFVGPS